MADKTPNRFTHGLLNGLGFSLAVIIVLIAARYITKAVLSQEQYSGTSDWKSYNENSGLVITEHNPIRTDNNLEVIGVLSNKSLETWSGISIEVELFASNGKFIDECSEYIASNLAPAKIENFKVNCGGCEKRKVTDFDHYEISVKHANYVPPNNDI